jgi:hypothetical protein
VTEVAAGWFAVEVPGFDGLEQPVSMKTKDRNNVDTNFVEAFISISPEFVALPS